MIEPDTNFPNAHILIAEDEDGTRMALVRALQLLGYAIDGVANGAEAVKQLASAPYDLLLLDLKMPEMDGVQVMDVLQHAYPELSVIILTANPTLDSAIAAVKAGAIDYLLKPQSISSIEAAIQRALQRQKVEQQRQHLIGVMKGALESLQTAGTVHLPQEEQPESGREPGLYLDLEQRQVTLYAYDGEQNHFPRLTAELTEHQAAILNCFIHHPRKALTNTELASLALGYNGLSEREAENIIRPHILRLRRKIEEDPTHPHIILSIRGKGYLYSPL